MQNINPSRNIDRRGRYYLFLGFLAFFGGGIAVALAILFFYVPLWDTMLFDLLEIALLALGVIFVMVGIGTIIRAIRLQKDNPLAYAVGEGLAQFLDNRYTYLRNVSKRSVGYIDAVLVGPPGVLVFRIVDYTGVWKNERDRWVVQTKNSNLRKASTNPTHECVKDVYALRKFLAKKDLQRVPVYGIVVFTSPNVRLSAADPVVPICEISTLYRIMEREYLQDNRIAPPAVAQTRDAIYDG